MPIAPPPRDYKTLDAIVVVGGLFLCAGIGAALVFVEIPGPNLPILASLGTGILGLVVAYASARWGNKRPSSDGAAKSEDEKP